MRGVWHHLKAIPSPEQRPDGETLVCFALDKQFSSELELDHDIHRIAGSLRRIQLGINELDRLLSSDAGTLVPETKEKVESLKQSVKVLDSYTTHLLHQLSRSLGFT